MAFKYGTNTNTLRFTHKPSEATDLVVKAGLDGIEWEITV